MPMSVSGDITQKGYEKKRMKLLSPYLSSQKAAGTACIVVLFLYLRELLSSLLDFLTVLFAEPWFGSGNSLFAL